MSGLEIVSPIILAVAIIMTARRLRKRRKEIKRMEQMLDQQGIAYQPSSMYRRKHWYSRGKVRRYSGLEEGKDWNEYN